MTDDHLSFGVLVGTGQHLHKVTRDEIIRLNMDEEYLDEERGWIYRFPFQDELYQSWETIRIRVMRRPIYNIPRERFSSIFDPDIHYRPSLSLDFQRAPNKGINIEVPCPGMFRKCDYPLLVSGDYPDKEVPIAIVGEQYQNGSPATAFACGVCGKMFVCNRKEISVLREFIKSEQLQPRGDV